MRELNYKLAKLSEWSDDDWIELRIVSSRSGKAAVARELNAFGLVDDSWENLAPLEEDNKRTFWVNPSGSRDHEYYKDLSHAVEYAIRYRSRCRKAEANTRELDV